jgi:hypothetical protein
MAAHRYWRLYIERTNDNNTGGAGIAELQLRTAIGGANQATTAGNFSASSTNGSFPLSNLIDGSTSTRWQSTASYPVWVQYDFGAGNEKDIVEVSIAPSSSNHSIAPNTFSLQWSDDASSWTTLLSVSDYSDWSGSTAVAWSANDTVAVLASGQAWRIYVTASSGGGNTIGTTEVEMRATVGGADQCTGGRALGSSMTTGFGARFAFDNNTTNAWQSHSTGVPGWIGYKFSSAVSVAEMTIRAASSFAQSFGSLAVEKWDGSAWVQMASWTGQSWSAGETKTFAITASTARPRVFVCT